MCDSSSGQRDATPCPAPESTTAPESLPAVSRGAIAMRLFRCEKLKRWGRLRRVVRDDCCEGATRASSEPFATTAHRSSAAAISATTSSSPQGWCGWVAGSRQMRVALGRPRRGGRGRFGSSRHEIHCPCGFPQSPPAGARNSRRQAQVRPRIEREFQAQAHSLENRESSNHQGLRDGETRTRTGDTTIFSRRVELSNSTKMPGNERVSAGCAWVSKPRRFHSFRRGSGDGRLLVSRWRPMLPGAGPLATENTRAQV